MSSLDPQSYLGGHSWAELTREKRHFCEVLAAQARSDPLALVRRLKQLAPGRLDLLEGGDAEAWDAAADVHLYRDLLWHQGREGRPPRFSPQRAFDACLFGARDLVIIEAVLDQSFDVVSANVAREDRKRLPDLLGEACPRIWLCAVAPAARLENGGAQAAAAFADVAISWRELYRLYGEPRLLQADLMGLEAQRLLASPRLEGRG